ncbi:MAG: MEDS domain-containing protein, partial [Acidimicrobiia bacterium]
MTDTENGAAGVSFADGEHVCVFYRGPGERDAFLREWVGAGFAAGDKCLCVAGAADAAAMADSLQAGAPAPPRPDQLTVLPVARYLTDGSFVPEATFARWDALIGGYVGDGFERVRGVGDLSWVLDAGEPADPSRTGPLLRYEALCNTLVGRHPVSIACMYDLDRFGADVVAAVLDQHSAVLAGGVLFRADRPRCAGEAAAEAEAPELA